MSKKKKVSNQIVEDAKFVEVSPSEELQEQIDNANAKANGETVAVSDQEAARVAEQAKIPWSSRLFNKIGGHFGKNKQFYKGVAAGVGITAAATVVAAEVSARRSSQSPQEVIDGEYATLRIDVEPVSQDVVEETTISE